MKKTLLLITMMTFISNLTYSEELSKEDALFLYNLNKQIFNDKEIHMNYHLCNYQNEVAKVSGKELLHCSQRIQSKNDTEKGDLKLQQMEDQADQIVQIGKTSKEIEFDKLMDFEIKKLQRKNGR